MKATMNDLLKLTHHTKSKLAEKTHVSRMSIHNWCNNPQRFINAERSRNIDRILGVKAGTTMDVIMGHHTKRSLLEATERRRA